MRLMICPLVMELTKTPSIIGVRCNPALVGSRPFTTCKYTGSSVIEPNSAMPTMKPIDVAMTKARFEKSDNGSSGSPTVASTYTKAASDRTPRSAMAPRLTGASAMSVPPRLLRRMAQVSVIASRAAPA